MTNNLKQLGLAVQNYETGADSFDFGLSNGMPQPDAAICHGVSVLAYARVDGVSSSDDGFDDLVLGAGSCGGPHVKVFAGATTDDASASAHSGGANFLFADGSVRFAMGDGSVRSLSDSIDLF